MSNETEVDRLAVAESRHRQLLAERDKQLTDIAIEREAGRHGFRHPEIGPLLVDRESIRVDDKGNVIGATEAIEKVIRENPDFIRIGSGGGSPQSIPSGRRSRGIVGAREMTGEEMAVVHQVRRLVRYPGSF